MTAGQDIGAEQAVFRAAMEDYFGTLDGTVGVMVRDLRTGRELAYNHRERFPTASTLKVPLLYELFRQADEGRVDLGERIALRHDTRVPGSGILQHLDEGLQPTLRDLAELMIIVSDNWATDLVYERIGKANLAVTLQRLGLAQTHVPMTIRELFITLTDLDPQDPGLTYQILRDRLDSYRAAADNLAYSDDTRNDVSSPADMVRLMTLIHEGHGLSAQGRESILRILRNQNFNTIIPARLPDDEKIEVAHKTGSLRGIRNDVGIVYAPRATYAIAFMSKGHGDIPELVDRMARASRWIWDHLTGTVPVAS